MVTIAQLGRNRWAGRSGEMSLLQLSVLLKRRAALIAFLLVVAATARIASTWNVFNHTVDEPAHISCGMQFLSKGIYQYEHQHPPLTRVMVALGPYLLGERTPGDPDMNYNGLHILHRSGRYDTVLALARAGNLPFFWLASWMAFLWGRRIYGAEGAVLSVFVFTALPIVLAHAGLATTDMGATAFLGAALYCFFQTIEKPTWRNGILFGFSFAGMTLSKFSGLAYFAAALGSALVVWLWMKRPSPGELLAAGQRLALPVALSIPIALLVVWTGYRFSFGQSVWFSGPVPFPELFSGIDQVRTHNAAGQLTYLLGELSMKGSWAYFPILIAVKTPIAMLVCLAAALGIRVSKPSQSRTTAWPGWLPWVICGSALLVAMSGNINIGLRHLLPAYVLLSVIASGGLLALLAAAPARRWALPAFALLCLWLTATSAAAHPDYLAYFNAFAGESPENIVVDSDLDWGQDMKRLGARMRELGAPSLTFTNFLLADLDAFGFPPRQPNDPRGPSPGWNAVSLTNLKLFRLGWLMKNPELKPWPELVRPTERVGQSILLYYFSEPPAAPPR
jgi:4-amino-4-deoxy-L-arabinose transferase-like glycosyltransferase